MDNPELKALLDDYAFVIVKTLRPHDPDSWVQNEIFIRIMLVRLVEKVTHEATNAPNVH